MAAVTFDDLLERTTPGAAAAQQVKWQPEAWIRRSSAHGLGWQPIIEHLSEASIAVSPRTVELSRATVHGVAARCPEEFSPAELLLASCIWGFGRHPRARARVESMLSGDGADQVLLEVHEASRTDAGTGFSALFEGGKARVPGLGVAFGTKFVHFAANHMPRPEPLIYDRFVALALRELVSPDFPLANCFVSRESYTRYAELADEKAQRGLSPEDVEFALFSHGRTLSRETPLRDG
jgi:8-oxoguanine DNA glycosylase-like protein